MLDGVCVVWAGLLKKPLEVVCRRPHQAPVAVCGGRDVSHTGPARFLVTTIIMACHGCGP
jgi:hypothetical protein